MREIAALSETQRRAGGVERVGSLRVYNFIMVLAVLVRTLFAFGRGTRLAMLAPVAENDPLGAGAMWLRSTKMESR